MSSSTERPFIGSWQMANKTLVRHTPDAIVLINGHSEMATCATCNKGLNFQKYVTQVSCDATTDPIASANLTLAIPRHESDVFSYDGNYILQPSLEVVIFMRGYFPMTGIAGMGQDPSDMGGFIADDTPVYPYYQVFRGVVTSVTHDFNGGFYTATLQCANLLHFWQNQKLSTNGAVIGDRPDNSQVSPSLIGHVFTNTNPYSIVYTLVKVGFGAAFGVEFQISQGSNIAAVDDDDRKALYAHAAEWWAKRWTEHSGSLRMYGMNGSIMNAYQQAYLGSWYDSREDRDNEKTPLFKLAQTVINAQKDNNDFDLTRYRKILDALAATQYDPYMTSAGAYRDDKSGKKATLDVLSMAAFTLDVGKIGSVNMFETEYMSKMEIIELVKTITGFEFYQDVDGDLVYKPPMYNLDTRDDPVYRIEDRDLISISETETEPEATMCKGTGSHFANITGVGLENWLGVGGVFIDYRLVAKYGYREETFESNYMNNKQALFVSAINRLDLANVGVKSASITIPLRPEMRAGYPVYVVHLDCFFYAQSINHSFQYGGQCTSTINGVAKRAKWLPPMETPGDGTLPSLSHVRLDAPGEFPPLPMFGYDQYMTGDAEANTGPPRAYGFPNVVMALDPDHVNLNTIDLGSGAITAEGYIQIALASGFIERGVEADTFLIRTSNTEAVTVSLSEVQQNWTSASEAIKAGTYEPDLSTELGLVIHQIQTKASRLDTPDSSGLINYLSLQTSLKGLFAPGTAATGRYRYYSCSHPVEAMQGPGNLYVDQEVGTSAVLLPDPPEEGATSQIRAITDAGNGMGIALDTTPRAIQRGIKIAAFSQKTHPGNHEFPSQIVATSDIRFVTFGPQTVRKELKVSVKTSGWNKGANFDMPPTTMTSMAGLLAIKVVPDPGASIKDRFDTEYQRLLTSINTFADAVGARADPAVALIESFVTTIASSLVEYGFWPEGSELHTVGSTAPMKGDMEQVSFLAQVLASGLWDYVRTVVDVVKADTEFQGDYTELMAARYQFIEEYTEGALTVPEGKTNVVYVPGLNYEPTQNFSPIFPVSDAGGYEVYGNLPYGRGVNIEKLSELLQSTTSGDDTDDPVLAAESSQTFVGSVGSNATSLDAVEKFFILYLDGGDPQTIISNLPPAERAAVLAAANTPLENITSETVEALIHDTASRDIKVRNNPVTSFSRGQSVTGAVAAANLSNITIGASTCVCKGVEASFLLQAFSEEYVRLYEDPLQAYQEQLASQQGLAWKAGRDALAGSTLDTRNTSLFDEFAAQGNTAKTLGSSSLVDAKQALQGREAALDDLVDGE